MTAKRIPCLSRREFLQASAALSAALSCKNGWATVTAAERAFEHGNPLQQFGYGDVTFAPGLHQAQLEQTHDILMGMNEDSLLRPFRLAAGAPAPGWDLGGWYSATPAHASGPGPETFGQWISALSRYYAVTAEEATRLKVQRLIEGFAELIEPSGKIFRCCSSPTFFYDKLVCGLEDAYQFAGIESALSLLSHTTDAAVSHLTGKAIDQLGPEGQKSGESYTIPENQFIAWQRGAGSRHLEMARRYLADDFYFEPLARGENVLPRRHSYSHVNALSSAAKAYLVLGDEKYLKAAANGLAFVEQQSFVTGGWGTNEHFLPLPGSEYTDPATKKKQQYPALNTLGDAIEHATAHFETPCGAYAHFKLTRYLLRITKNPHYGDSMERVMYNTVLGALPLNKFGKAFYQSNYHAHAHKAYFDGYGNFMEDEWPCCSGTLPQIAADYRISTYFHDPNGLFINLYIPSTVRWQQGRAQLALTQSGRYPLDDEVNFHIKASRPTRCAIHLRIPSWAKAPSIEVNGERFVSPIQAGTFVRIQRVWREGDRIELKTPCSLELKAVDEKHPDLVALCHGPLVLFALSDDAPKVTRDALLSARQSIPGADEWHVATSNGRLRFVPFWAIKDETYFTYFSTGYEASAASGQVK